MERRPLWTPDLACTSRRACKSTRSPLEMTIRATAEPNGRCAPVSLRYPILADENKSRAPQVGRTPTDPHDDSLAAVQQVHPSRRDRPPSAVEAADGFSEFTFRGRVKVASLGLGVSMAIIAGLFRFHLGRMGGAAIICAWRLVKHLTRCLTIRTLRSCGSVDSVFCEKARVAAAATGAVRLNRRCPLIPGHANRRRSTSGTRRTEHMCGPSGLLSIGLL